MKDVFEVCDRISTANGLNDVQDMFGRFCNDRGFDNVALVEWSYDAYGYKSDIFFNDWNADWLQHYAEQDYVSSDPVLKAGFVQQHPFQWSSFKQPEYAQFFNEAGDFGLNEGLLIPLRSMDGNLHCVALAGDQIDDNPNLGSELLLAAATASAQILLHDDPTEIKLKPVEKEIINWLRAGKTQVEIGMIIGMDAAMVNWHMANVKKKTNSVSNIQAISSIHVRQLLP